MIGQIHLQMAMQRTDSVSQTQQIQQQRPVVENSQAHVQVQKNVQKAQDTVIPKDSLELNQFRYDAKEESKNKYQDNRKKQKKQNDNQEEVESKEQEFAQPRVNFDIQI